MHVHCKKWYVVLCNGIVEPNWSVKQHNVQRQIALGGRVSSQKYAVQEGIGARRHGCIMLIGVRLCLVARAYKGVHQQWWQSVQALGCYGPWAYRAKCALAHSVARLEHAGSATQEAAHAPMMPQPLPFSLRMGTTRPIMRHDTVHNLGIKICPTHSFALIVLVFALLDFGFAIGLYKSISK